MRRSSNESELSASVRAEVAERLFIPEPELVTEKELTIVKVGTDAAPDWEAVRRILAEVEALRNDELDQDVILVWSMGVRTGMEIEERTEFPKDVMDMRLLSGTGWPVFVERLGSELDTRPFSLQVTRADLRDSQMHAGIHEMIRYAFGCGRLIVMNEDDARSSEEFEKAGTVDYLDNDGLARRMAVDCMADRLIIVTDVPGVYDKDPKVHEDAQKLGKVPAGETVVADTAGKSSGGRGGMSSKREEIELARDAGIEVFVTDARPGQIVAAVDRWRPFRGTHLEAHPNKQTSA